MNEAEQIQVQQPTPITTIQIGDENCRIEARGRFLDKDTSGYFPSPESERLQIEVPDFEGPLDLLLHLIKKHSLDILDIPILLITQKYSAALDEMQTLDLDVAGEFILMAATLAEIKSRMLLPKEDLEEIDGEGEEGPDPRAELVKRLLEYKKFKEAAANLSDMSALNSNSFFRPITDDSFSSGADLLLPEPKGPPKVENVEIFELIELFSGAIKRAEPAIAHSIQFDRVSVSARINEMIDFSRLRAEFSLVDAIRFFGAKNASDIVVTFLALLEMARLKLLRIIQQPGQKHIVLSAIEENLSVADDEVMADLKKDVLPN